MAMKTTSKEGLLLKAKITCDGEFYYLICSVENCKPFEYGAYKSIEEALKGMTMFQLGKTND